MAREGDILKLLGRSPRRREILEALVGDARTLRGLHDELDTPRTTLRDNLDGMEELGLVARDHNRRYRTTSVGRLVLEGFDWFRGTVSAAVELEPFFQWVDYEALDADFEVLTDAEVVTDCDGHANRTVRRLLDFLADADRARCLCPVVTPLYAETLRRDIVEADTGGSLVLEADAAEALRESYPDVREGLAAADRLEVSVYDGQLPFGMVATEGTIALQSYDDHDYPRALLVLGSEAAREWAVDRHDAYRTGARPLDATGGSVSTPVSGEDAS